VGTSISKWNVELVPAIPQECAIIHRYTRNGFTEKEKKATRHNQSVTQFSGVLRDMVELASNRMEYITLFVELFPVAQGMEDTLDMLWQDIEREHDKDYTRNNKLKGYVSYWGLYYLRDRY